MKNKLYFKFLSLFALLFLVFSNSLWSAELDTVWVSDYGTEIRFQHPVSKNIIISTGARIRELDSKDGKLVKEIEFGNESKLDLSPDGTKLLSVVLDDTYIYEYPSMELIIKLEFCRLSKFINNDEVISETSGKSILVKYNLKTKESLKLSNFSYVQDIATSPDGRFIAISTIEIPGSNDDWTKLFLLDAKTMNTIALLEEIKNTGHKYERLNFSKDGKYLTYSSQLYNEDFQRNIYSTETFKAVKNFNINEFNFDYLDLKFISNNLYALSTYIYKNNVSIIQVKDVNTDKTLLEVSNAIGFTFNKDLSHLYYTVPKDKKIICLNISNLITGVTSPQPITIVKYQNKELIINKENVRRVEISDISGRLIMNKIIENPFTNNTILPINLLNGAYLINITTDKESLTHKLLVME